MRDTAIMDRRRDLFTMMRSLPPGPERDQVQAEFRKCGRMLSKSFRADIEKEKAAVLHLLLLKSLKISREKLLLEGCRLQCRSYRQKY